MNLRILLLAACSTLALPSCQTGAYNEPGFQGMRTKFQFSKNAQAPAALPWWPADAPSH